LSNAWPASSSIRQELRLSDRSALPEADSALTASAGGGRHTHNPHQCDKQVIRRVIQYCFVQYHSVGTAQGQSLAHVPSSILSQGSATHPNQSSLLAWNPLLLGHGQCQGRRHQDNQLYCYRHQLQEDHHIWRPSTVQQRHRHQSPEVQRQQRKRIQSPLAYGGTFAPVPRTAPNAAAPSRPNLS